MASATPMYFRNSWVDFSGINNRYATVWVDSNNTGSYPSWSNDSSCFATTRNSGTRVVFFSGSISTISKLEECAASVQPPVQLFLSENSRDAGGGGVADADVLVTLIGGLLVACIAVALGRLP